MEATFIKSRIHFPTKLYTLAVNVTMWIIIKFHKNYDVICTVYISCPNQILNVTAYEDLQTRKETREAAWQRPGWDECVAYTGNVLILVCLTKCIYTLNV